MSGFDPIDLSSWEPPEAEPRRPSNLPAPAIGRGVDAPPPAAASQDPEAATAGEPVAWKAAASSVPRLRQKPVATPASDAANAFPGFAQDAPARRSPAPLGQRPARATEAAHGDQAPAAPTPLSVEPPLWEIWLDHLRMIPLPVALGGCVGLLLLVAVSFVLFPRDQARVSLARIRQQPEAFDGRVVHVRGKAGEVFLLGSSYVFNLRQGRDTIVVYSRTRRPRLNEEVRANGTVSVGYLDGMPRIALFEVPPSP